MVTIAQGVVEHSVVTIVSPTTHQESTPSTKDGYNLEFSFLPGIALGREALSFGYTSGQESSTTSGASSTQELFALPADPNRSPRDMSEGSAYRTPPPGARPNDENSGNDGDFDIYERDRCSRSDRTLLRDAPKVLDIDDPENARRRRIAAQDRLPGRVQYQS